MKPASVLSILAVVASTIFISCKEDDEQIPPAAPAACRITKEYIVGKREYVAYEYEGVLPKKIVSYNEVETPDVTLEVLALEVRKTSNPSGFQTIMSTHYNTDYLQLSPTSASVSFTYDNLTTVDANTFLYRYDSKGRMIEVMQQTPNTNGDLEYMLTVSYDEKDNVTRLRYSLITGPRDEITVIDVMGYDDHPTPYAGVIGWTFLMSNFTWNNSDPLPVILALSKNNPGAYEVYYKGSQNFSASFVYQYNSDGFPTQREHINKNQGGEHRFSSMFEYECK